MIAHDRITRLQVGAVQEAVLELAAADDLGALIDPTAADVGTALSKACKDAH